MFNRSLLMSFFSALCVAVLITGCESSDDDNASLSNTGDGSATVSGVLDSISGAFVPAGVLGITVDLVQDGKTILRTMTDASGRFTFNNVPAGAFTLVFHVEGTELTRPVTVAEGSNGSTQNVVLGRVRVSTAGDVEDVIDEEATIEVVVVVEPAPADPAPASIAPAAIDISNSWHFNWLNNSINYTNTLVVQQDTGGNITGQMDNLVVSGAVQGSSVTLNFALANATRMILKSATGTAVATAPGVVPSPGPGQGLPHARYMSGTWVGTLGETGTWDAYLLPN